MDMINDGELEELWKTQIDTIDRDLLEESVKEDKKNEGQPSEDSRQEENHIPTNDAMENVSLEDQQGRINADNNSKEGPGVKGKSLVSDLIASQEKSNVEIERLTSLLSQKKAEIVRLKTNPIEELGLVSGLQQENEALKVEVKELTKKLLHAHENFNDRISALLPKLSGP
ncbi:hypothetical protein HAX54_032370 [Datura stramonium]|uniref:Uncharacterized protein n=1 Tax=Datura stramonium TaxID=4076 RepID=A0ABS8VBE3_DATST|nr:hypothetical protein [Datura stramonium]